MVVELVALVAALGFLVLLVVAWRYMERGEAPKRKRTKRTERERVGQR